MNFHELDVARPPQYGVVGPWEVYHLELQLLSAEIRGVPERNPHNDPLERASTMVGRDDVN